MPAPETCSLAETKGERRAEVGATGLAASDAWPVLPETVMLREDAPWHSRPRRTWCNCICDVRKGEVFSGSVDQGGAWRLEEISESPTEIHH